MRSLETAARAEGKAFDLTAYPEAQHGFILAAYPRVYRRDDAEDAWRRTIAFPKQHHPAAER